MSDQKIFPAAPGHALARFRFADRKPTIDFIRETAQYLPIIAWDVSSGVVLPLAFGDVQPSDADCVEVVHFPNGMFFAAVHANVAGTARPGSQWNEGCAPRHRNPFHVRHRRHSRR